MAKDTIVALYSILITGIFLSSLPTTEGQQNCTTLNCYVSLGTAFSRLLAYQKCVNNGYQPVKIYNKETADMLSKKYSNFWLNIQSQDPGYYSYVNGRTYHTFEGEAPPPSQKQCAFIHSDYIRNSVNPNLEYCYKRNYALCAKKNCSNNCFFMTAEQKSWFDSRNDCRMRSGDLAVVIMADGLPPFQGPLWIGLRHEIWYYVDTNKEVTFTNWADNRPEHTEKKCVISNKYGKWIDVPCEGEERNVLCYTDDPPSTLSTQQQIAIIAGASTAAVVILLVLLVILILCLWRRNKSPGKKCNCSCPCLPISCCVNHQKPKQKETQPTGHKSKRQSVRDFVSSFKVPNLRKQLFKEKINSHDEEDVMTMPRDNQRSHTSGRFNPRAPTPIRAAPAPPVMKKTKPLPPIPKKHGQENHKMSRPFSGLKQSLMKRFSKSSSEFPRHAPPLDHEPNEMANIHNRQPISHNQTQEPKFLDNRQCVPVSEMSLRKQLNQNKTLTQDGNSNKLPPPPSRQAPELKEIVRNKLPPVPPPKHNPAM